jgi:hypothetical protein
VDSGDGRSGVVVGLVSRVSHAREVKLRAGSPAIRTSREAERAADQVREAADDRESQSESLLFVALAVKLYEGLNAADLIKREAASAICNGQIVA